MPRHSFSFPQEVRDIVRNYVDRQIYDIDSKRYNQEPKYVTTLLTRLEGIVYEGNFGYVQFKVTDIDDRGFNSAESVSGADFAITAVVSDGVTNIEKAILFQAKLGIIEEMNEGNLDFLKGQIEKMKDFTRSPKILEIEETGHVRLPSVISGNDVLNDRPYIKTHFSDYIVRRVLTTFDGDTSPNFVDAVQHSSLPKLNIKAVTPITKENNISDIEYG